MGDKVDKEDDGVDLRQYRVPGFCPVCGSLMRGDKSSVTYYEYGCCVHCYIEFVEDRVARWKSGWRPSEEEITKLVKTLDHPHDHS